jgi:hypothetical protein
MPKDPAGFFDGAFVPWEKIRDQPFFKGWSQISP